MSAGTAPGIRNRIPMVAPSGWCACPSTIKPPAPAVLRFNVIDVCAYRLDNDRPMNIGEAKLSSDLTDPIRWSYI